MKLSAFATIVAVLAGAFGVALIFFTSQMGKFYGTIPPTPELMWVSRYFGAALIFIALIYWSYKDVSPAAKSWPKLLIFSIIYDAMQLIITTLALTSGSGSSNGWSTVVLYALLIIGSIYFLGVCNRARAKAAV